MVGDQDRVASAVLLLLPKVVQHFLAALPYFCVASLYLPIEIPYFLVAWKILIIISLILYPLVFRFLCEVWGFFPLDLREIISSILFLSFSYSPSWWLDDPSMMMRVVKAEDSLAWDY